MACYCCPLLLLLIGSFSILRLNHEEVFLLEMLSLIALSMLKGKKKKESSISFALLCSQQPRYVIVRDWEINSRKKGWPHCMEQTHSCWERQQNKERGWKENGENVYTKWLSIEQCVESIMTFEGLFVNTQKKNYNNTERWLHDGFISWQLISFFIPEALSHFCVDWHAE